LKQKEVLAAQVFIATNMNFGRVYERWGGTSYPGGWKYAC